MENETSLEQKIYNAQSIGNVEPIEFMIPYPSMRSLIEGQNIKYSEQKIIEKPYTTNLDFYNYIQKTANWLQSLDAKPKDIIIIPKLAYPQSEIILYGIWQLGAVALLPGKTQLIEIKKQIKNMIEIDNSINLFDEIKSFSNKYKPKYKPNLSENALITFETGVGIKLSHYNLLINASGIQKTLDLKSNTKYYSNLNPTSSSWAIFQAILPIYSGSVFNKKDPEITIGKNNCFYNLRFDYENIHHFNENEFAICAENTAALSLGGNPIHLTEFSLQKNTLNIKGHSVMMGYLDKRLNEERFNKDSLSVKF
tara:strand:+ start:340 stop:1269 length:930 start_codon:yes stop_codon:yes gene_type:complete